MPVRQSQPAMTRPGGTAIGAAPLKERKSAALVKRHREHRMRRFECKKTNYLGRSSGSADRIKCARVRRGACAAPDVAAAIYLGQKALQLLQLSGLTAGRAIRFMLDHDFAASLTAKVPAITVSFCR